MGRGLDNLFSALAQRKKKEHGPGAPMGYKDGVRCKCGCPLVLSNREWSMYQRLRGE